MKNFENVSRLWLFKELVRVNNKNSKKIEPNERCQSAYRVTLLMNHLLQIGKLFFFVYDTMAWRAILYFEKLILQFLIKGDALYTETLFLPWALTWSDLLCSLELFWKILSPTFHVITMRPSLPMKDYNLFRQQLFG